MATFTALCDLALQTPLGSVYGTGRPSDLTWLDVHPGHRFIQLLDVVEDDDWIAGLDEVHGLQQSLAARMGWPDPDAIFTAGADVDFGPLRAAMQLRRRKPSFHLSIENPATKDFRSEFGPIFRHPRTGTMVVPGDYDNKLSSVVNFALWRWRWQVMTEPSIDLDETVPDDIYDYTVFDNVGTKRHLLDILTSAVPEYRRENFTGLDER
jgi:hypothetical protein